MEGARHVRPLSKLGADILHLMMGSESVQTGGITIPAPITTAPGLSKIKRKKAYSRLVASKGFLRGGKSDVARALPVKPRGLPARLGAPEQRL